MTFSPNVVMAELNLTFLQALGLSSLGPIVINLIGSIAILLVGWIVAALAAKVIRSLLVRTDLDTRLAGMVAGQPGIGRLNIDNLGAGIVFWIILILAVVAALNVLNLTTVSQPLNNFLNQIFVFLPKLGAAALLIVVAWVLATLARAIAIRTAQSFGLDERLTSVQTPPTDTTDPTGATETIGTAGTAGTTATTESSPPPTPFLLSHTLGDVLYWFIFLFFLPLVLGVLDLQGPLQPVQNLLNEILAALPKILKAVLIGVVGWFIARIVRQIVTNLLAATGLDRTGAQVGLSSARGGRSLSWLVGTVVYVLILIPTGTAALDALQIPAISQPATSMLNQILNVLPQIFTAGVVLVVAYFIGKFLADLVTNILVGIGFNNILYWIGIQREPYVTPSPTPVGEPRITRSPSEIVGVVVLVGIMLFATVAATNILNIPALTVIVTELLAIFGRILVGLVIFATGLYLANLAFNLIASSGDSQSRLLGQTARIAIIALVAAMALQQIGIAPNIVNLAFGLLLGSVAVAIAVAFGLGGRDVAAEQLREWLAAFKRRD